MGRTSRKLWWYSQVDVTLDYEVLAVDAPAHGYSSRGDTNMFEYIDLITQITKQENPETIISHLWKCGDRWCAQKNPQYLNQRLDYGDDST